MQNQDCARNSKKCKLRFILLELKHQNAEDKEADNRDAWANMIEAGFATGDDFGSYDGAMTACEV